MNDSVGASLSVAASGGGGHAPVDGAVSHQAQRGHSVSNDIGAASAVDISAVQVRVTAAARAALGAHAREDVGNGATGAAGGRLEELGHLGVGAGRGSVLADLRKTGTAAEGALDGREAGAGAVGLDVGALLLPGDADGSRGLAINFGIDGVGLKRDRANKLGGVLLGEGESTRSGDGELATGGEVVELGHVEGHLNGLASRNALESIFLEVLKRHLDASTAELNALLYDSVSFKVAL